MEINGFHFGVGRYKYRNFPLPEPVFYSQASNKVKMKSLTISFVVLASFIGLVYSQGSTTNGPATNVPPQLVTQLKTFHDDMHKNRETGIYDAAKVVGNLKAMSSTVQTNIRTLSQEMQDEFRPIQAQIQQLQATTDEQQVKRAAQSLLRFIDSAFPGARSGMRSMNGPPGGPRSTTARSN